GEAARAVAVARPGLVALVGRRAAVRGPAADAAGAHNGGSASGRVIPGRAVRLAREAARAVAVARAGLVALVGRRAAVRRPAADPAGAHIGLGARIPFITGRAIRLAREAARAVAVARAGLVALVGRRAAVRGPAADPAGAH